MRTRCARFLTSTSRRPRLKPPSPRVAQELFKAGRLNPALELCGPTVRPDGATELAFRCRGSGEEVCTVVCADDELTIEQRYTYPVHPRALDTGVDDTAKGGEHTAGGFGDGFKTAVVALLALPGGACESLRWEFVSGGRRLRWDFRGVAREAVGTFSKARVLEVRLGSSHRCCERVLRAVCCAARDCLVLTIAVWW